MYHQDKFLLRQFNHLNRSIQELRDKREIKEETEVWIRFHRTNEIFRHHFHTHGLYTAVSCIILARKTTYDLAFFRQSQSKQVVKSKKHRVIAKQGPKILQAKQQNLYNKKTQPGRSSVENSNWRTLNKLKYERQKSDKQNQNYKRNQVNKNMN